MDDIEIIYKIFIVIMDTIKMKYISIWLYLN